jgi:hypothetical protein
MTHSQDIEPVLEILKDNPQEDRRCVVPPIGCGRLIVDDYTSWDVLVKEQYSISGLCDKCQEK